VSVQQIAEANSLIMASVFEGGLVLIFLSSLAIVFPNVDLFNQAPGDPPIM